MDRVLDRDRDREQWGLVLSAVKRAAGRLPKPKRRPRFPDWLVVAMYLWAVWHDRCLSWACDRSHYGRLFRPRKLPSVSQFTRRIRSDRCAPGDAAELLRRQAAAGQPREQGPRRRPRAGERGLGQGVKLHAWGTEDGRIPLFCVTPLHAGECPVAETLAWLLPPLPPGALVLTDTNFDDRDLHKPVNARGGALVSPLKGQKEHPPEAGRHPVTLRQMGPGRRELLRAWAEAPGLVRHVLKGRARIENTFSRVTFAGLGHLPPFVRGIGRVTRWAGAKLILYHALLRAKGPAPLPPAWG